MFDNVKPTLYLIRGVPGSGKSSFAKQLLKSGVVDRFYEADMFFQKLTGDYDFEPSKLGEAHLWCQCITRETLLLRYNTAVSNTSTTEKEVEVYHKIAEDCNANFVSIVVENRHGGVNIHNVPEEKVQQMKNRFSVKL